MCHFSNNCFLSFHYIMHTRNKFSKPHQLTSSWFQYLVTTFACVLHITIMSFQNYNIFSLLLLMKLLSDSTVTCLCRYFPISVLRSVRLAAGYSSSCHNMLTLIDSSLEYGTGFATHARTHASLFLLLLLLLPCYYYTS